MLMDEMVHVRYLVDDVDASIAFYSELLGFEVRMSAAPAFADVIRGNLRLLLSGPLSSAGRPMTDGATPGPGGWNRIHFHVDDIDAEIARLPRRRRPVPQRRGGRPRGQAGPAPRPVGQRDRAVPARGSLTSGCGRGHGTPLDGEVHERVRGGQRDVEGPAFERRDPVGHEEGRRVLPPAAAADGGPTALHLGPATPPHVGHGERRVRDPLGGDDELRPEARRSCRGRDSRRVRPHDRRVVERKAAGREHRQHLTRGDRGTGGCRPLGEPVEALLRCCTRRLERRGRPRSWALPPAAHDREPRSTGVVARVRREA